MKHTQLLIIGLLLLLAACDRRTDIPPPEAEPAPVVIYAEISDSGPPRELTLTVWEVLLDPYSKHPAPAKVTRMPDTGTPFNGIQPTVDKTAIFFTPPISGPAYISLGDSESQYITRYIVEPGDSVKIRADRKNHVLAFGGPAAEKFKLQAELHTQAVSDNFAVPSRIFMLATGQLTDGEQSQMDLQNASFGRKVSAVLGRDHREDLLLDDLSRIDDAPYGRILHKYTGLVPEEFLGLIRTEYLSRIRLAAWKNFNLLSSAAFNKKDGTADQERPESLLGLLEEKAAYQPDAGVRGEHSFQYLSLAEEMYRARAAVKDTFALDLIYGEENTPVREALLAKFLTGSRNLALAGPERLERAAGHISGSPYREIVAALLDAHGEGSPLHPFAFTDSRGGTVRPEDLRGKVLLMDFWFTGCKACVHFTESVLAELEAEYGSRGDLLTLSVSTDRNTGTWRESLKSGKYGTASALHLHIGEGEAREQFLQHYNIHLYPHVMLVDREGNLVKSGFSKPTAESLGRELDRLLAAEPTDKNIHNQTNH